MEVTLITAGYLALGVVIGLAIVMVAAVTIASLVHFYATDANMEWDVAEVIKNLQENRRNLVKLDNSWANHALLQERLRIESELQAKLMALIFSYL